ncbi:MAG: AAA family ATPase [Ardenticatenaceae bacterium]|nr:AAA family ATPase [Anaerolineales bacterium]MCB8941085.1 AAA family ATPase [Ardenticatenaceae bacterium]MCB8972426.1 AAA family ATPase [Ardenticatenaceae bacterium]
MSTLKIFLFGTPQFEKEDEAANGRSTPTFLSDKVRALLIYLAVEQGRPFRREALAGLLWPNMPEAKARANLRRALSNLRQVIADEDGRYLHITRQTVQFNPASPAFVDAVQFETLLENPEPTISQLEEAVSLVNGRFLEGFSITDSIAFEEWALVKREHYQQQALRLLNQLTRHHEAQRQFANALHFAQRQTQLEPWHEPGQRQLLRLLAKTGQRTKALRQFERFKTDLAVELQVEPESETVRLHQQIQSGVFGQSSQTPPTFLEEPSAVPQHPFVARQAELAILHEQLETAVSGQGGIFFITGEAGSGKTTLVREFSRRAQTSHPQLLCLFGNCLAHVGNSNPYLPFRTAVSMLAGNIEPHWHSGLLSRPQAAQLWQRQTQTQQILHDQGPNLAGIFFTPTETRQQSSAVPPQFILFEQLTNVLRAVSRQFPILLLLDDLQWIDPGSMDLLFHLSQQIAGYPILVVGAYRPEEVDNLPTSGERHPLHRLVHELQTQSGESIALNRVAGRPFVDAWLDCEPNQLDESFRQTLLHQTKGNPLFTVELVAALKERGGLVRSSEGFWQAGKTIPWELLPARAEAMIAERIERLSLPIQQVLSVAAVQGEQFIAETVANIVNAQPHTLLRQFSQELGRIHRLVQATGRQLVNGQHISLYTFRHSMFQQFLYGRLDPIERATLHHKTGERLEILYKNEKELESDKAATLAWHFDEAQQPEKAITYHKIAGHQAFQVSGNQEAVTHFQKALQLLANLPPSPEKIQQELTLLTSLGTPLISLKGYAHPDVGQIYQRAHVICQQIEQAGGTTPLLIPVLAWLVSYYITIGSHRQALELAEKTFALTSQSQDETTQLLGHLLLCVPNIFLGNFETSLAHSSQLANRYSQEKHGKLLWEFGLDAGVTGHFWTASNLLYLGQAEAAQAHAEQAISLARGLEHPFMLSYALMTAGCEFHFLRQNIEAVQRYAEELLVVASQNGFMLDQAQAQFYLGWVKAFGQPNDPDTVQEGCEQMETAVTVGKAAGYNLMIPSRLITLAQFCLKLGNTDKAQHLLTEAKTQIAHSEERYFEPEYHRVLAALSQQIGQSSAEIDASYQNAVSLACQQKSKLLEERATISHAQWQQHAS